MPDLDVDEIERKAAKLQQSITVAQMAELSKELDLEILAELAGGETRYQTLEPLMDPTRWMKEHKGVEATYAVMRAALDFARVVRESMAVKQ